MTTVNIDNVEYDFDGLSEEAKGQFNSLKFVEAELMRTEALVAVLKTARMTYGRALKAALPVAVQDETIKF